MKLRHKRRRNRWPNGPRFTVGSVSGVKINLGAFGGGGGRMSKPLPTVWYVHDAANCYRVVAETGWDEKKARSIAADLNAEQQAWLESVA